ncbi:MAG: ATP-dependent Clp protease adaptor ClpS [Cyclobacteriaceae bacterium]
MDFGYQELEEVEVLEDTGLEDEKNLVVFNDDHNTFDHVIKTLIKVCKHDQLQAEQCTYIIHFNGKCAVKKGELPTLKPMREGIVDAGINAEIH